MTWERSFQRSRRIHVKLLTLLEEIKDSSWGGLRRSLYSSLQYGYTHTQHRHRLQLFVHPWHSFISLSVFNTMKRKNLRAAHLKMPVLILVKDSHSSVVETVTQSVPCSVPGSPFWSLRSLLATPRGDETKTVTIATVCGTSRICNNSFNSNNFCRRLDTSLISFELFSAVWWSNASRKQPLGCSHISWRKWLKNATALT